MRYLLGNLSEDEKTRIEEGYFSEDSNFEAIELAEDELIDAYVRNELPSEDHGRFQALLTRSPRIAERVKFARVLASRADAFAPEDALPQAAALRSPGSKQKTAWRSALFPARPQLGTAVAVYAALLLVAAISLIGWFRIRNESARLAAERATLERQNQALAEKTSELERKTVELTARLQHEREQHSEDQKPMESRQQREASPPAMLGIITSLFLSPGGTRGSHSQSELKVRPETATLQLNLALETNDYSRYNVTVRTPNDKTVLTRKAIKPRTSSSVNSLVISIPVSRLSSNNYLVHVDGISDSGRIENVTDYFFRVIK